MRRRKTEGRGVSRVFVKRTMALETASFLVHSKENVLYLGVEFLDLLLVSPSGSYEFSYFYFGVHHLRE